MANPQNTPSEQDMNISDNNPNMGGYAGDRYAGAPMQSDDEMVPNEPIAYDEETDILIETPGEAEGAESANVQRAENEGMTPNAMDYTGGATPETRAGTRQGPTPSSTGLEGAGSREPGGEGDITANSGLEGAEVSPSNSGIVGQGLTEEDEPLPPNP